MKLVLIFPIFLFVMLISCCKIQNYDCKGKDHLPSNDFITADKAAKISDILCKYINDKEIPCIQLSIIDSLGNILNFSVGTIDKKRTHPLNDYHLLRLASITKSFTATLILKLQEEKRLNLEDKLVQYFPDFINASDVTIKNLLDHSSGIKELLTLPNILAGSTLVPKKIWDINAIVKTIADKKLVFLTGTDHRYSNTNYVLLGLIAEKVTGKKISDLYREYIFNKLKINNIALVPQDKIPGNLISGYDRKLLPTPGWYEVTPRNTAWASAAFSSGALVGNSEQTALFFHHLLSGGLLSQNSLDLMEDFREALHPDNEYQKFFGLGLFKFTVNRKICYGHEGVFIGADNIACYRLLDKTTIVILTNISTFSKFELLKEIDNEF